MFLPGDRFSIYYDDWFLKTNKEPMKDVRIGSCRKVLIEVKRVYFDPVGDYAFVCQRCDTAANNGCEFVFRLSECNITF